ncbi:MAG: hypothetical protein IT246_00065, partial [Bacteroidia bacterium]|nr:hypothetical protein [Bacteroidia bacterium]
MKKTIKLLSCILGFATASFAQQVEETNELVKQLEQQIQSHESDLKLLKQFKISGYIHSQFQYGEKNASLRI